ncbi:lipid droplet-associated protein [Pseudonocardia sp. ICBG601]|uniref:lipid droplet-associated protein n=1 Tax=Pseudonocardia sp. ICBG601 TaxID=2846759 RepID=UPI0027E2A74D|nr:lipid droplet-associated protein [Pseudonocardia sp. ICBG601]
MTAVSQALQVSMRVQQRITELAIKGDRALGTLRPADDVPSWATFDDDLADGADLLALPDPEPIAPPLPPRRPGRPQTAPCRRCGPPAPASRSTGPRRSRPAAASNRAEASATVPAVLPRVPDDDRAQLRGKLRTLSLDDLADLLAWETAHENRPPYVTMLTNRIATVSENR